MKTTVMKVTSEKKSIQGGVVRLTENKAGNYSIEGDCLRGKSRHLVATFLNAIDVFLAGYEDPAARNQVLRVFKI